MGIACKICKYTMDSYESNLLLMYNDGIYYICWFLVQLIIYNLNDYGFEIWY